MMRRRKMGYTAITIGKIGVRWIPFYSISLRLHSVATSESHLVEFYLMFLMMMTTKNSSQISF